jgi:5-enolpyruvylshikimate-3-phosphate synthase
VGIEMGDATGEAVGMGVQSSDRLRKEKERKRKYRARKAGPVDVSAKIASQQMKSSEKYRAYQSKEHVQERHAEEKINLYHSTKTAQQAGSVDVSAKIASQQMKRAIIYRTYNSKEHVKERRVENKRNTRHSTKAAQQAADVDGNIEATKKMCANKKQRYQESKYLQEHGADLLRGGRAEVDGDFCDNCRRKNFSSDTRYALEFEVVLNTKI